MQYEASLVFKGIVEADTEEQAKEKFAEELGDEMFCMLSPDDVDVKPCETNLQAIKNMDSKELARFITDLTHYDDTDYEWKSNLTPLLPFEDWEDWLNRRAIYGKGR